MAHVVVFAGEYDLYDKEVLRRTFHRLESSDNLVLDLAEVTYIDSTFIAELILLEKVRRANGFYRVTVVTPLKSVIRRVFEVTGVSSILGLVESYDRQSIESVVEFAANAESLDANGKADRSWNASRNTAE